MPLLYLSTTRGRGGALFPPRRFRPKYGSRCRVSPASRRGGRSTRTAPPTGCSPRVVAVAEAARAGAGPHVRHEDPILPRRAVSRTTRPRGGVARRWRTGMLFRAAALDTGREHRARLPGPAAFAPLLLRRPPRWLPPRPSRCPPPRQRPRVASVRFDRGPAPDRAWPPAAGGRVSGSSMTRAEGADAAVRTSSSTRRAGGGSPPILSRRKRGSRCVCGTRPACRARRLVPDESP